MATKTVTIDTNEWAYPDMNGVTHTVTNAQTFTFELTDTSTTDVKYAINDLQKLTTTDGFTIELRPLVDGRSNTKKFFGPFADTQDATTLYNVPGELVCACPTTGTVQIFKPSTFLVDDVDTPTAITAKFEDQFGNSFNWTTITVA